MRVVFLFIFSIVYIYANIGVVVDSVGNSTLLRSGKFLKIEKKIEIKLHDTIVTQKGAMVKIFFKDKTVVSLGEKTSFAVDSYFYENNNKKSNIKFRVLKGFFKTVTGEISKVAPQRFKLETKNATIGIRGTVFAAEVGEKVDVTICTNGTIVITTDAGSYELNKGGVARVSKSSAPKISKYTQKQKREIIKKSGWHGSMAQKELEGYIKKNYKEPLRSQLLGTLNSVLKKDNNINRKIKTKIKNSESTLQDADDLGFIDDITINGREFDELPHSIEFYTEDLKAGKVTISGLLESDKKSIPVNELSVAVSIDGGDSWRISKGHADWEFEFAPKIGKTYELSLKVVRKKPTDTQNDDTDIDIPHILNINGFILTLGDDVLMEGGKLSGSGTLFIPVLQTISANANLNVNFNNLEFSNNLVTLGDIEYDKTIDLQTSMVDVSITKLTVSPIAANNKIEGQVTFKGDFSFLPSIGLADASALLPSSFSFVVPVPAQEFSILPSHNVKLKMDAGNIKIDYALGKTLPTVDISSLKPKLDFGDILQSAVGSATSVVADLQSAADTTGSYTLSLADGTAAYLYGKNISLQNLNLGFKLKDKSVHMESGIDFDNYGNPVLKHITNAILSADISPSGFSGKISASANLDPIVILNRGGVGKDVRVIFGDNSTVNLSLGDSDIDVDFEGLDMSVDFGDLLKSGVKNASSIVASLSKIDGAYFLDLPEGTKAYLMGENIILDDLDLGFDMDKKSIHISSSVDFSNYDNVIAKKFTNATLSADISSSGFSGKINASANLDPIVILNRGGVDKDVRLIFEKKPSLSLSLDGVKPSFSFKNLDANIDFGDILTTDISGAKSIVAKLQSLKEGAKAYKLSIDGDAKAYLLGQNILLEGLDMSFDMAKKSLHVNSSVDFSNYGNVIAKKFTNATLSADISSDGFIGEISVQSNIKPITVFDRGGEGKDVRLIFNNTIKPTFSIEVKNLSSLPKIGVKNIDASIDFGTLIKDAKTDIKTVEKGAASLLSWSIKGTKNLIDEKIKLSSLRGSLDLKDISAPTIKFSSKVDLSGYGGIFEKVKNEILKDATISKSGFSASVSIGLSDLPIWQKKGVKLHFDKNPTLHVEVKKSGLKVGFSDLSAKLYFGQALDGAIATISKIADVAEDAKKFAKDAKQSASKAKETASSSGVYDWSLSGAHDLLGSKISLSGLMGSLDFSNLSDPKIVLNATVDMSNYSTVFKYVTSATLKDAQISKIGFKGSVEANIRDIDIWKDKNVKLAFDEKYKPKFNLKLTARGLSIGISNVKAKVDFGDIFDGAKVSLKNLRDDVYSWSIEGSKELIDGIDLSGLSGSINLASLKNPVLNLNADVSFGDNLGFEISSASLRNAYISRGGFKGDVSASINDITVWSEKRVKVQFDAQNPPVLGIKVTRDGFDVSVKSLSASLNFGDLLDGQIVTLAKAVATVEDIQKYGKSVASALKRGKYSWSLSGNHDLIKNGNAKVVVDAIGGEIDLGSLSDPIIHFHANADFSQYLSDFASLGSIALTDSKISKDGIDWNLVIQGAGTEFTILDLGTRDEDVRAEISNLNAHAGTGGSGVDSADGKLYFGKLFDGTVEPIDLYYDSEGVYSFSTTQVLTYKKGDTTIVFSSISGSVEKQSDGAYKVKFGGNIGVKADIFTKVGIQTLSFTNIEIGSSGMSGNVTANFNNQRYAILNNKVVLILTKVGLGVNTNWNIPFKLTAFDGKVDLSEIFDGTAEAALAYVNSNIHWSFDKTVNVGKFEFKSLNGGFDFSAATPYVSIGGNFGYTDIDDLSITLNNFKVNRYGISGNIALASDLDFPGISGLKITKFETTFSSSAISGAFGLQYNKDNFLGSTTPFELKLSAAIDSSGIHDLGLSSTAIRDLSISNFAKFTFDTVAANPSFSNFWIKLSGYVQPDNSMFSAVSQVEFQNLKISKNGVSIDGAGVEFDVSGVDASLGGFGLSIEKLGLGFSNSKFYISTKGTLSLKIAEAGAGLKLYSDGSIDVDSIKVMVNNPAVTFAGEIAWYKDDPIYGNGFGTLSPLQLSIASMFSVKGAFKLGQKNGLYWMAKAQGSLGPSGIPLGPVTIYELGGGAAYNMSIQKSGSGQNETYDFVPSGANNIVIILSSLMGTPDLGFTWHGQIDLNVDSAGQIVMIGDTYILSPKNTSDSDKWIHGTITLGMSPASLHITAGANISYMGIGVNGAVDIMFDGSEKHIFIGTDPHAKGFNVTEPLGNVTVTIFGMGPQGYFMIDTRRLAFGASYHFERKLVLHLWGPNPYLELKANARGDALIQYNPFFMDLGIEADMSMTAGYGDLFSGTLGAGLAIKFRAPNPSYARVRAYVDIPIYGNASFTAYFPKKPSSSSADSIPNLINHIEPYEDSNVSLMPEMKIVTTFNSDGSHFDVGDMDIDARGKITNVAARKGYFETFQKLYYVSEVKNVYLRDLTNNHLIDIDKVQFAQNEIKALPKYQALVPGHRYKLSGVVTLSYYYERKKANFNGQEEMFDALGEPDAYLQNHGEMIGSGLVEVKREDFIKEFTVSSENKLKFSEVIDRVYPANLQEDVLEGESIVLYYSERVKNLGIDNRLIRNYSVKVTDAKNKPVTGEFFYNDSDGIPKSVFKPTKALRVYYFCMNNATGEVKETFKNRDGEYLNPFLGYRVDGENSSSDNNNITVPSYISSATLSHVEVGKFELSSRDGSYSYFTNNTYNILITDSSTNQIAYFSTFGVKYNSSDKESIRKFEAMKDMVEPSMIISKNIDHPEQFRIDTDSGLGAIEAYYGIKRIVKTKWRLEDDSEQNVESKDGVDTVHLRKAGVGLLDAKVEYRAGETNELLATITVDNISNGEDYSTAAIEEAQERARNGSQEARSTAELVGVARGGNGSGGGFAPDGSGIGNVGGGYNPTDMMGGAFDAGGVAREGVKVGAEFNLGGAF